MKISVITPSYNQGKFLEQTISSIWGQVGDFELEHIIADGGSIDNSGEIIKKYEELYKSNKYPINCNKLTLVWWSKKDKGQVDALNRGFKLATGEIVGWLNSDDILDRKDALQQVARAFSSSKADIIVGNCRVINETGKELSQPPILSNSMDNAKLQKKLKLLLDVCFIPQPATYFKRELYLELGIKNYHYGMDWDLWIRSYLEKKKFYKLDYPVASFRMQSEGKTTKLSPQYYKETIEILQKYNPQSKQILINQILLAKEYIVSIPILGPIAELFFNISLKSYLFIKTNIFKTNKPLFTR